MANDPIEYQLLEFLYSFISERRKELFQEILAYRTRHITVVLENIFQPHNASAVLRTCEILGVQDVHIIEDRNPFELSHAVTQGSAKWLDLHRYNTKNATSTCANQLKENGYQLVCATPHSGKSLYDLDIDTPLAVCFGTELDGATDELMQACDLGFRIPMYGFTESYNISVSAALVLFHLTEKLKAKGWKGLSDKEARAVELDWARKSVRDPEKLERHFREKGGLDARLQG